MEMLKYNLTNAVVHENETIILSLINFADQNKQLKRSLPHTSFEFFSSHQDST